MGVVALLSMYIRGVDTFLLEGDIHGLDGTHPDTELAGNAAGIVELHFHGLPVPDEKGPGRTDAGTEAAVNAPRLVAVDVLLHGSVSMLRSLRYLTAFLKFVSVPSTSMTMRDSALGDMLASGC
jgi:hypothetical protein